MLEFDRISLPGFRIGNGGAGGILHRFDYPLFGNVHVDAAATLADLVLGGSS